jgi:predicted nucleotidyltransferase
MGSHAETENGEYSDIDMIFVARDGVESYFHKNGDPY